jgi:hypothetical protein
MNEVPALLEPSDRAQRIIAPTDRRLARMRFLSRLLDNAILLPGGYRIGLDPLLGLLPGAGDFLGGTLSLWLIYDAARLGISKRTLARMGLNVLLDTTVGAVPVVGDVMDALWKSNARNMRLVEAEYKPGQRDRSFAQIGLTFLLVVLSIYAMLLGAAYLMLKGLIALFGGLFG